MLTQEKLKEFLHYNFETGVFTWIKGRRGHYGNRQAMCTTKRGYVRIKICGKEYRAQNLAWLYVHGRWPLYVLDHKDRDSKNNRLNNLREATLSQNAANRAVHSSNKLGLKGVCAVGRGFQAQVKKNGRTYYLGNFSTPEEAHRVYSAAAIRLHGQFAHIQE